MKNRSGFTLIELLVVMGLIIAIVAMAVPNFSAMMKGRKLDSAVNLVRSTILQAKSKAASGHIQRSVEFCHDLNTDAQKGQDMMRVEYEYEYVKGAQTDLSIGDDNMVDEGDPPKLPVGVRFDFTFPGHPIDHDPYSADWAWWQGTGRGESEYTTVNRSETTPHYKNLDPSDQAGFPDIIFNPDGTLMEGFNPVIVLKDEQGNIVKLMVLRNTGQVVEIKD